MKQPVFLPTQISATIVGPDRDRVIDLIPADLIPDARGTVPMLRKSGSYTYNVVLLQCCYIKNILQTHYVYICVCMCKYTYKNKLYVF